MGQHEPEQPVAAPSSLEPELPPDSMRSTLDSNTTEQTASTLEEEVNLEPFVAFEVENRDRVEIDSLADLTTDAPWPEFKRNVVGVAPEDMPPPSPAEPIIDDPV
eukprot:5544003-Alexandrium_andersonii.AAC.1